MALYRYKARSGRGDMVEGMLEGGSPDAVASQLLNSGVTPIDIKEAPAAQPTTVQEAFTRLTSRPPELTDLMMFSRQMYTLMRSGIPINRAISALIESTRNAELVETLRDIQVDLESGRDLGSSLSRHPGIFSTLYVSMIRVGENTGRLDESFLRVSQYLERERDTRERIKSALRYPVFVVVAISFALAVINLWVVPAFRRVFERANVDLPLPTRILIATSDFFVANWPLLLLALVAAVVGFRAYVGTQQGRYRWDKAKLRLPIVGDLLNRAILGRFARSFSMALGAGVPLIQALTVVSRAVGNDYVGEHVAQMRTGIERGDSLTRTAAITGMFSPLVLQMLAIGEETGSVDQLLEEVAGFYEREVDYDLRNLSAVIEPILIVALGVMVLILALGVFLPMWELMNVARGG
ncbi:MAG: type II secretion system F family protein [Gammaproteobacteria bacterium]|nr:type II secretion system F family protein [Gammaproteobacteria bacterium]